MKIFSAWAALTLASLGQTLDLRGMSLIEHTDPVKRAEVQNLVTWDEKSVFINGERVMLFSGEIHPFRLPVPSLWLDLFQKLKAAGFNCVSFYTDWALYEAKRGEYVADGIFDIEPFFEAAKEAGIWLIGRPGPYINAEVSGGGFPGWMQRVKSPFRHSNPDYLEATDNYMKHMAGAMAKAQITNGGPIILFQPENEYTFGRNGIAFPDGPYMQYVIDQAYDAGIVVPIISNDAHPQGHNAPGSGVGEVDIYGHDAYPLGFNCAAPDEWPAGKLPTNWRRLHLEQSPNTPYAILEYQGGSYDAWGGNGYDMCAQLLNHEFTRVFNKNTFSFGINILNIYMTFGGTNWGNLGYPRGYTSYDYGALVAEDRTVAREKYSDTKLLAYFSKAAPVYREAVPGTLTTGLTNNNAITVTPLRSNSSSFWVVRHSAYENREVSQYKITLPTSQGNITIPQLEDSLSLHGRDSKILITDFDLGDGTTLVYSSAELLAAGNFGGKRTVILYGGPDETHELAIKSSDEAKSTGRLSRIEGPDVQTETADATAVISWKVSPERRILEFGGVRVILLHRNDAYNYWVSEVKSSTDDQSIVVNGPYVVRNTKLSGSSLRISADFNQTTTVEVLGAPASAKNLYINGKKVRVTVDDNGIWSSDITVDFPELELPDFESLEWKYHDSLPEVRNDYDDSAWTPADLETTYNDYRNQTTPHSLYSGDYGYHSGLFIYRGHFTAKGNETTYRVRTQGGWAGGSSAWLNDTYLGSSPVHLRVADSNATYSLPDLEAGQQYVLTVLQDNQGYELNPFVGQDEMKSPRGILSYQLDGHEADDISWKLTGNLGGEDYVDRVRGPQNEGGTFIERQGYHQPYPPTNQDGWDTKNPITDGLDAPGIGYFTTSFKLDVPKGWDVPLYFTFGNSTAPPPSFRAQLFVNGYNFGRYLSAVGPQTSFYVPQGILNYDGKNWIGLTIWGQEEEGVKLDGLKLEYKMPVLSSIGKVKNAPQPKWKKRKNAY